MEYTINKLSNLTGVSPRTLRYYEEIKLLNPRRISSNNYRIYGEEEIKLLQQILFYRELDFPLEEIKAIITNESFDIAGALNTHLSTLLSKRQQMDILIENIRKTIAAEKGEGIIMDKERFEGFKENLIKENEKNYGIEIRKKYGEDVIDKSNDKFKGISKEIYEKAEALDKEILNLLKEEVKVNNPASENAQKICELHKQWLNIYWPTGMYSKEAHLELGKMYVYDERFKSHYETSGKGSTEFLLEALKIYCK